MSIRKQPPLAEGAANFRRATVTSLSRIIRPCYRIRLTDGREIVSSAEHLWLTGFRPTSDPRCEVCGRTWSSAKNAAIHKAKMHGIGTNWTDGRFSWVATQDLKPGTLIKDLGVPWDEDTSKGGGYLAGVYDGEGSLSVKGAGAAGFKVDFTQLPGDVMDHVQFLLKERGYHFTACSCPVRAGPTRRHPSTSRSLAPTTACASLARRVPSDCFPRFPRGLRESAPSTRLARTRSPWKVSRTSVSARLWRSGRAHGHCSQKGYTVIIL